MTKSFLANTLQASTPSDTCASATVPDREPIRVVIFGSRKGVTSYILTLYSLGFAQVHEWSPLLPSYNPGEFMSILTRYLLTN
jgi:hypothetical protein